MQRAFEWSVVSVFVNEILFAQEPDYMKGMEE